MSLAQRFGENAAETGWPKRAPELGHFDCFFVVESGPVWCGDLLLNIDNNSHENSL